MDNTTIVINQPLQIASSHKFNWDKFEIIVSGSGKSNQRIATIRVPVLDQDNKLVRTEELKFSGADFNTFWAAYSNDKTAIVAFLTAKGYSGIDWTSFPNDILNTIPA